MKQIIKSIWDRFMNIMPKQQSLPLLGKVEPYTKYKEVAISEGSTDKTTESEVEITPKFEHLTPEVQAQILGIPHQDYSAEIPVENFGPIVVMDDEVTHEPIIVSVPVEVTKKVRAPRKAKAPVTSADVDVVKADVAKPKRKNKKSE